jgi:F-type H+-transporting ATPase subunit b
LGTLINLYGGTFLAKAADKTPSVGDERIFGLDPQLLFDAGILALNIFLLFTLLSYLLFNPVRKMLKNRQEKITSDRESAILDKEEAEKLKLLYDDKLKHVEKEAELLLSEARRKALQNEQRIIEEARREATGILEHARAEAVLEKQKMADEVKKEIILVSTLMAQKIVAVSIDEDMQNNLIKQTIGEMGDKTWLS